MPIDKTKCCKTHTKEKETSGECCQLDEKKDAEQATYEYSPKSMSLHELAKANPTLTYRQIEKLKEQHE